MVSARLACVSSVSFLTKSFFDGCRGGWNAGFYFFDDAESTELRNILNGRIPAYSRVVRQSDGREDVLELLPEDAVFDWERMHGIIIVISAVDPRVEADSFPQTFLAMKEVLRQRGSSLLS